MKLLNFKHVLLRKIVVSLSALFATAIHAQTLTSSSSGTHDGFYYTFWKDSGNPSMTLGPSGNYSTKWNNSTNNWFGGKGWQVGNNSRVINYSGYFGASNSQNAYLSVYGWTRNPLIQYFIIESYGSYNPSQCAGGTDYGSFQSDGATYNVRRCKPNGPVLDMEGAELYIYFSVRNPKKGFGNISGTVTFANHQKFWASKGLSLGNHSYQIVATEGYQSSGTSDITVSETIVSSSSSSSIASSSVGTSSSRSSSSLGSGVPCRCNWYGTLYPSCVTTKIGWGWENNKSCISNSACTAQPANQGGLVCSGG